MTSKLPVAVPAYRRADLLLGLLESLPADRVSRAYVSIDGARPGAEEDVRATIHAAHEFAARGSFEVLVHALPRNAGAATNVLGAVNWMLRHEERGAVLEDDCHPIPEFFDFVNAALDKYSEREDIWLACGTQVAPASLIHGNHLLSRYPLIWGWGVTREQYARALGALRESLSASAWPWLLTAAGASPVERYWHGGHRRAAQGFVDAWDLPLVYAMRGAHASAVLPATPLVSNVGDDARATHTANEERWTRLEPQALTLPLVAAPASDGQVVDVWLERNLYGISARHLLSTSVRWAMDVVQRRRIRPALATRLSEVDTLWADAAAPRRY